jgi:hypothetical protein
VNIWFNGAARSQGGGPTCVSERGGEASGSLANPCDGLAGSRVRHTRQPNRRASRVINFSVGRWLTAQTLKKRRPGGAGPSAVHGSSGAGALGDAIAPLPFNVIFRRWVPGLTAAAQAEARHANRGFQRPRFRRNEILPGLTSLCRWIAPNFRMFAEFRPRRSPVKHCGASPSSCGGSQGTYGGQEGRAHHYSVVRG